MNSDAEYMRTIMAMQKNNNELAQASADRANRFTWQSQLQAQDFNAHEASKSRAWQEYMSNTAHQREVKDLQLAGLNPVLSANNGASVTSGATASSGSTSGQKAELDMQAAQLYASRMINKMNNANALKINKLNNKAASAIANTNAAASMYGANAGITAASISASAARDVANTNLLNSREQRAFDETHDPTALLTGYMADVVNALIGDGSIVQKGSDLLDKAGNKVGEVVGNVIKWFKGYQSRGNNSKPSNGSAS